MLTKKDLTIYTFLYFISISNLSFVHAKMYTNVSTFLNCSYETIRDQNVLINIFKDITDALNQKSIGDTTINHTESGYTLLQALQKGGYISLCVDNNANTTYLNTLIDELSPHYKKIWRTIVQRVKEKLEATSYTT